MKFIEVLFNSLTAIFTFLNEVFFKKWTENEKILSSTEIPILIKSWVPWIIIVSAVVALIFALLSQRRQIFTREVRSKILSDFHQNIFIIPPDKDTYNRITYYKEARICRFYWCGFKTLFVLVGLRFKFPSLRIKIGNHLIIDCRTGRWQKSRTAFKIHRDIEKSNEGIAGLTWFTQDTQIKEDLADLSQDKKRDLKSYLDQTNINEEHLNTLNIKCRSILGINITDINGERAGVIVIDSARQKLGINVAMVMSDLAPKLTYTVR